MKNFEAPVVEIMKFEVEDVITVSGSGEHDNAYGDSGSFASN